MVPFCVLGLEQFQTVFKNLRMVVERVLLINIHMAFSWPLFHKRLLSHLKSLLQKIPALSIILIRLASVSLST
jgi:hypothetical protein